MRIAVAALLAAAASLLLAAGSADSATTALRLDGVPFRPELALTGPARSTGLMGRKRAPADGMLFVFPGNTNSGFWMKDTLVPLTILFFDAAGARVQRFAMAPCRRDPCAVYAPRRPYRFALELRSTDTRAGRVLGPRSELLRLARRAT